MNLNAKQADLLVIGGGILGTFHAYHAIEKGLRVIHLERHQAPIGATVRNFGQIVPSGMNTFWQQLGRESLRIYKDLQTEVDLTVKEEGSIYLASNTEELVLLEELSQINEQNAYLSKMLTKEQCHARFPSLNESYCVGGLFFPEEISVNPRVMIHRLHRHLQEHPLYLGYFGEEVNELEVQADGTVQATTTKNGAYTAQKSIVCGGTEIRTLFPQTFLSSNLEIVQLQMMRIAGDKTVSLPGNVLTGLTIRRYESFQDCPSWGETIDNWDPDPFQKEFGIHILFKQESDGSILLGDSHEYAKAGDEGILPFTNRSDINRFFIDEGKQIFNLPRWDVTETWLGRYSQTSDPRGVVSETIDDHIHLITGIGGKGMTAGPGFAKAQIKEIFND